jgi:hypothetical protein
VYVTESHDGQHKHTVRRDGTGFRCDCAALGLCHHIIDSVVWLYRRQGVGTVQVWTSLDDAKRQRRRRHELRANGKPFWVTVARLDPLAGVVRFCRSWDGEAVDLYRRNPDGTDRHERREDADWNALREAARARGWREFGDYWWRPGELSF